MYTSKAIHCCVIHINCTVCDLLYLQIFGIHLNKWKLDFKLGVYLLVLYAVFLCFSIMIEYNVFTFVNLPMCQDE